MKFRVHKTYSGIVYDEEDDFWWMECLVEMDDGSFTDYTICSTEMNDLYAIEKHFRSPTIQPYVIEGPDD